MFCYVALASLTILTASSNGAKTRALPKPCCLPKQHTSMMTISTGMMLPDGKLHTSYSTYNFSYDSNRDSVAMKGEAISIPDGQKSHWWIIQNMKDGLTYTIDQDSKKCSKSTMIQKPLYCIPETAEYQYSSTYGYGDKQILGDTWLITKDEGMRYFTVSGDGMCIPLSGHGYSQNPVTINSTTITNFVPKILDPSAFAVPAECQ